MSLSSPLPPLDRFRTNRIADSQLSNKQSPYECQKSLLVDQLCHFLASLPMPKYLVSASPRDLVYFLGWKDKSRKTPVHAIGCPRWGITCPSQCDWPHWLAPGPLTP